MGAADIGCSTVAAIGQIIFIHPVDNSIEAAVFAGQVERIHAAGRFGGRDGAIGIVVVVGDTKGHINDEDLGACQGGKEW